MIQKKTIGLIMSFFLVYSLAAGLCGCDFFSGLFSKVAQNNTDIENAYKEYRKAIQAGDIDSLRKLVSREKAHELEGDNAEQMLKLVRVLYPPHATVTGTYVKGNAATLTASAVANGSTIRGIVHLLKEEGQWKVYEENWELKSADVSQKDSSVRIPEQAPPSQRAEEAASPLNDEVPAGAEGEAVIVKDGIKETYVLKTGFFSETRFKDPRRAEIQFQFPGEEFSNARRIEMTLDATRTGRHYADGKAINDSMFHDKELNIGEKTPKGRTAIFRFVADGGQIFPPKSSCTINITSSYTGTPNGVFAGEVSDCTVHSAGIDYNISSVIFMMRGVPSH